MRNERLCMLAFCIAMFMFLEPSEGKKVVIHVPYKIKNIKHTHTIYKVLPSHEHEEKKDVGLASSEDEEEFDHFKK